MSKNNGLAIFKHFNPKVAPVPTEVQEEMEGFAENAQNNPDTCHKEYKQYRKASLNHIMNVGLVHEHTRRPNSPRTATNRAVAGFSLEAGALAIRTLIKGNFSPFKA